MCLEPDGLSSALACPLDLGARPTCRGLRAPLYANYQGLPQGELCPGKGSAPGCVPKLLLGNADSAVNGGNQGPSAPVLGRELHSQSVPPFVPRKHLPDWASLELCCRAETCGCVLGP